MIPVLLLLSVLNQCRAEVMFRKQLVQQLNQQRLITCSQVVSRSTPQLLHWQRKWNRKYEKYLGNSRLHKPRRCEMCRCIWGLCTFSSTYFWYQVVPFSWWNLKLQCSFWLQGNADTAQSEGDDSDCWFAATLKTVRQQVTEATWGS